MAPSPLAPFTPKKRPSGILWIALNILRLISIIALVLVFASNIVTMVEDIKAINAFIDSGGSESAASSDNSTSTSTYEDDCDYIEYSTVPNQAGGAFWSILSRIFIVLECVLLALSECGVPKRFFELFLPVLGPAHGLGVLGVLQCLIGAQVLSHYIDLFPQVSAWMLFIVGCVNMAVGIIFRSSSKRRRLIFSWENVSQLTPHTKAAASAWDMVTDVSEKYKDYKSQKSDDADPLLPPGKTPGGKFGGFGFGKQGEKAAGLRGYTISKPVESLPRYATAPPKSAE